jgi:hypothetical protein
MLAVAAFAPLPDAPADAAPTHERVSRGHVLVVAVLALLAASWGLLILLPGFALWVGYGIASSDAALVVPNSVAFVVAAVTTIGAEWLRPARAGRCCHSVRRSSGP